MLDRDWYAEKGVTLPRPFGVGYTFIGMRRDIEVTDVSVSLLGLPPQSVSDLAKFEVENDTTLSMARIDAWALPFLNVYMLLGETRTDTALSTTFKTEPPGGGAPVPVTVVKNSRVNGPLYGGGASLIFGAGSLFCMADANYCRSDLPAFDGALEAIYMSSRVGWHGERGAWLYRSWVGVAYLDAARTLKITTDQPILGPMTIEIDQRPVNPWNAAIGGSVSLNNRWDVLCELGSNFEDATLVILSTTIRFP